MSGKLTFVPASGRAVEHLLTQRLTYVGRDKDCEIRLEDSSVDAKQFVISCVDQQAKIQNLSRKCPTEVNHKQIGLREDHELKDQDTISFGNKQFLWTMNPPSSGKINPPKHSCQKRPRVSEPVRKVAVVTPNRRETPLEEVWGAMPPEKRRRTMFDSSAATPEPSSFSRRVKYDKEMKQKKMSLSRKKQSVGKSPATPGPNTPRKKNLSSSHPLESLQPTYNREVFNKSITPGRFYRRSETPFRFRGFNTVPEEPASPGVLSGSDSFLLEESYMSRRSSARVSTPNPNKSVRGSTQAKTPQTRGPSGLYFPSIQEEMADHNQRSATPSSYFSSTSGSPRMMRAESPTTLPGGTSSPFQGRRTHAQSSRSSSYGTPQDQSLHSLNDSMYVNASGSSRLPLQDFGSSSMNQSRYSWTSEGIPSRQPGSFAKTPPRMRTPRQSVGSIESPGSATFSPNASEANTSGYVLLSPRGKSIINRAFSRNEMALQLSPQQSPARRLFKMSGRTPRSRRGVEPSQPLSVQVLTKSLRKNLNRAMNSPHNRLGSLASSERGRLSKPLTPVDSLPTPSNAEPEPDGTPKSTRSAILKRSTPLQSGDLDVISASHGSVGDAFIASTPVGAAKRKASVNSGGGCSTNLDDRSVPRSSGDTTNNLSIPSTSLETATPRRSVRSLGPSPGPPTEPGQSEGSRTSGYIAQSSAIPVAGASDSNSLVGDEKRSPRSSAKRCLGATPRQSSDPNLSRLTPRSRWSESMGATTRQASEPDLSRSSRKSHNQRKSELLPTPGGTSDEQLVIPDSQMNESVSTYDTENFEEAIASGASCTPPPVRVSNRSNTFIVSSPNKDAPDKSSSSSNKQSLDDETLPITSVEFTPRRSVRSLGPPTEPRQSRGSRTSGNIVQSSASAFVGTSNRNRFVGDEKRSPRSSAKRSLSATSRQSSDPNLSRLTRRLRQSEPASAASRQLSEPDLSRSARKSHNPRKSELLSTPGGTSDKRLETPESHMNERISTYDTENFGGATASAASCTPPPVGVLKRSNTFIVSSPDKDGPCKSSSSSSNQYLVNETPPNTSVEVTLRSSRKLSVKKRDSPTTPLAAKNVASRVLSRKRGMAKSLSADSLTKSPKSARKSLPVSLEGYSHKSEELAQEAAQSNREALSPMLARASTTRRSRASLVGVAARLLHLSASPDVTKTSIPNITVIPPTPTPASGEPMPGRRSSRRSGTPSVAALPGGIRKASAGRQSVNPQTPEYESPVPKSPEKRRRSSVSHELSSRHSSITTESVADVSSTFESPPKSSSESARVTPPRSVEPDIVMRSSRKTPRLLESDVPSTPTSALRRNSKRLVKKSPISSASRRNLSVGSARKDSVVKKLSLDPEKPDKNKIAALIACHKKKSPVKENRPSTSSPCEKVSPGSSAPETLTPLKDLDIRPEERSPEDALLDALDLSRKSAVVEQPKRPSRRLRSSNRRNSGQARAESSSKSRLASPPKSVKKLLFKTPLVEYEGSQTRADRSPSRGIKGILMPSTTPADEEPMSRVFTTSPVVDFTDASGRKKVFRMSPNSKSKVGGIHELVPADEPDLHVWTLFENPSSAAESPARKRRASETMNSPPKKVPTLQSSGAASPSVSTSRIQGESLNSSLVESAKKAANSRSTRRNLEEQLDPIAESSNPSTSSGAFPGISPKHSKRAVAKKSVTKAATAQPIPSSRTRSGAAKLPRKSLPKPPPRAGKTTNKAPLNVASSKAKPRKATPPVKAQSKTRGRQQNSLAKSPLKTRRGVVSSSQKVANRQSKSSSKSKSSTPAASPARTRRGAGAKTPKEAVQAGRSQPKSVGGKGVITTSAKSPSKTRQVAVAKKVVTKVSPKTKKTGRLATPKGKSGPKTSAIKTKSGPKASASKAESEPKATGKAKTGLKASTSKTKSVPKAKVALATPRGKSEPKTSTSKAKTRPKASTGKAVSEPKATGNAKIALKASTDKSKTKPKASHSKTNIVPKASTSKAKTGPKASARKISTKASAPSPAKKVSPRKTRGQSANTKAAPKPAQSAKPKPKLSIPPKALKGKVVGAKIVKKTAELSPVKTRSRKPAAAPTGKSSKVKR